MKTTNYKMVATVASFFIVIVFLFTVSSSECASYPNLSGRWIADGYEVWWISQSEDNRLTVEPKVKRGPFQGWFKDYDTIAVSFYDDPGCVVRDK